MIQVGSIAEIMALKKHLDDLKRKGLVTEWGISYEQVQKKFTAADFFLLPEDDSKLEQIWKELGEHRILQYWQNVAESGSGKKWRVEFNSGISL